MFCSQFTKSTFLTAIAFVAVAVFAASISAADAQTSTALAKLKADLPGMSLPKIEIQDYATTALSKSDAAAARELLYQAHANQIRPRRKKELDSGSLIDGELSMPFFIREFGKAPVNGHSVWISLHGGGGAPKQVNDDQWENQKRLYSLNEGLYVVPRAPTNTWNLWNESHIDRMFARLIEDLIVVHGADPDRVYVMGYSAGGDGVYQLAPRMADFWAAAAMMAGHPNDASPLSLRNVPFALQVGAKDSAYDRNKIAAEWGKTLDQLQAADAEGYPHYVKIHERHGHWMNLDDAAAIPWMAKHERNPIPRRVVWKQSSVVHDSLYWLAVPMDTAKVGSLISATIDKQTIEIQEAVDVAQVLIRVDDRMIDLDRPIRVIFRDKTLFEGIVPRTIATLAKTLASRNDVKLMFVGEIAVNLSQESQ